MFKAIIGNSAPQLQPEKVEDKEFSNEKRDLEIRIEKLENTIGNKIKKIQQIEKKEEEKEEIIKELTNRELKLLALNEVLKDSIKRKKEKIEELISSQIQNKLNIEKMNEELNKIREKYEELEKKYQTMLEEFVVPLRTKSDSFSEFNFCSPPPTKIPETDHRNNDNQIMESGQSGINGDKMQKFEINLNSENFEIFLEENNFEKLLNEIEKIKKEKLNFLNEKEELKKITEQQNEKNQKISQENHELLEEKENFLFKIDNLTRELKKIQENYTNLSTKFILTKEKQKSLKQHLKNEIQKKEVAEKSVLALKKQKETSNSAPVEKKVSFNVSPASHSPLLPENIKKFQKINPNSPNPPNTGRELSSAVGGSAATLLTSSMLHKRGRDVATAGKGADSNSPPKKKALKNGKYVISISGFKPNDKEFNSLFKSKLLKIINTLNGSFVENMDSSVTHVVCILVFPPLFSFSPFPFLLLFPSPFLSPFFPLIRLFPRPFLLPFFPPFSPFPFPSLFSFVLTNFPFSLLNLCSFYDHPL